MFHRHCQFCSHAFRLLSVALRATAMNSESAEACPVVWPCAATQERSNWVDVHLPLSRNACHRLDMNVRPSGSFSILSAGVRTLLLFSCVWKLKPNRRLVRSPFALELRFAVCVCVCLCLCLAWRGLVRIGTAWSGLACSSARFWGGLHPPPLPLPSFPGVAFWFRSVLGGSLPTRPVSPRLVLGASRLAGRLRPGPLFRGGSSPVPPRGISSE